MAKQKQTEQEKIDYQLQKLAYHVKKLRELGIGLETILQKVDLAPATFSQQILGTPLFEQPTIWRYLLFCVWRFEIVESQSNDTQTVITHRIGAYKNNYMRVGERAERQEIISLFYEPLGFEFQEHIPCYNNAMYYEQYQTIFPIPLEQMREVITLLRTKKDDDMCQENRSRAKAILRKML